MQDSGGVKGGDSYDDEDNKGRFGVIDTIYIHDAFGNTSLT